MTNEIFQDKCSQGCLLHNHGVLIQSEESSFLDTLSDIHISQGLPPVKIIQSALSRLQNYEVTFSVLFEYAIDYFFSGKK